MYWSCTCEKFTDRLETQVLNFNVIMFVTWALCTWCLQMSLNMPARDPVCESGATLQGFTVNVTAFFKLSGEGGEVWYFLKLLNMFSFERLFMRGVRSEPLVPPLNSFTFSRTPLKVQLFARCSPNTVEILRLTGQLSCVKNGGMSKKKKKTTDLRINVKLNLTYAWM